MHPHRWQLLAVTALVEQYECLGCGKRWTGYARIRLVAGVEVVDRPKPPI